MADPSSCENNSGCTIYAAAGCNPTPHCADWGDNGLIVFGAHHTVAVLDPNYNNSAKIIGTCTGHEARVNIVRWLRLSSPAPESFFISGADDNNAYIWQYQDQSYPNVRFNALKHNAPVTDIATLHFDRDSDYNIWLIATAADTEICLWMFDSRNIMKIQTISNGNSYTLGLTLFRLPKSKQLLLASGNEKGNIIIWAQDKPLEVTIKQENYPRFHQIIELSGHEDWVRALDIVEDNDAILLASAAQDNFIRLWRITKRTEKQAHENCIDICNMSDDNVAEIRVEEKILHLSAGNWCAISLESVLYGHEGWVYGVHWHKCKENGLRLLSTSIDKSLIIWTPNEDGIWMEKVRVGEVGGNSLGFYGGKFSSNGRSILGHSYQGGFHIWNQAKDNENCWTPGIIVGGHFDEVRDLQWAPNGEYLLTVSADQTSRIHAPWRQDGNNTSVESVTWHELARPQVHGYDLQTLAILTRYKFASGAEEKIVRTFQASANFIENFRRITHTQNEVEGDALLETLPRGASVPSLGLSNKAVYNIDIKPGAPEKHVKDEYPENYFVPVTLNTPPQEETLMQNTLWPEIQKLYGHGFEIFALAASPDAKVLASACRATNEEHAQIIIWNTTTWKQIQKLSAHKLTITQMRFSPDAHGNFLLSVSRDRTWTLFERYDSTVTNNQPLYRFKQRSVNKMPLHNRIIWTCDWSHDGKYFTTGGRDGILGVWTRQSQDVEWSICMKEVYNNPVTAAAFAPDYVNVGIYQLAVGYSTGEILLQQLQETNPTTNEIQLKVIDTKKFTLTKAHESTVKRLQFRPTSKSDDANCDYFLLASCGEDHFVKIFKCPK